MNNIKEFYMSLIILCIIIAGINGSQMLVEQLILYKLKRNKHKGNWKQAARTFGIRKRKLQKMSKSEIKKLYRKLAKKYHPDKGGNAQDFRNLHDAYKFAYTA